ncbi:MAG TPA: triose-phosphate isomerase [Cellvibrio sp.]|nr:triose-phosphate isomerase [Cellvibrio sp.]
MHGDMGFTVVANWKMNGDKKFVSQFVREIEQQQPKWRHLEVVLCPPQVYLDFTAQSIVSSSIKVGAQDVWTDDNGAATGNTSPMMLADLGVKYVIIGHSERRLYNREDNLMIVNKFRSACAAGLIPILCIGETAFAKENGRTLSTLFNQLEIILEFLKEFKSSEFIIAYEPLWSIGTGIAASYETIRCVHDFVKDIFLQHNVAVRILYGGSVSEMNIANIAAISSVDGVLVGGASLSFPRFFEICSLAEGCN